MADDPQATNFANNGAILMTLLSAGALLFSHIAPLQDARPDSKALQFHETPAVQTVEARLWQDPFTAVAKDFGGATSAIDCSKTEPDPHCRAVIDQLGFKEDPPPVSIIAATVSAAPYSEEEENRRRVRYALVSGLAVMDFVPTDAGHIGYAATSSQASTEVVGKSLCNDSVKEERLPDVIPFEWFRGKLDPSKKILVLWLDEDALSEHPLAKVSKLACLIAHDVPKSEPARKDAPAIFVIGPSWSDTLRDLIIEACNGPQIPNEKGSCDSKKDAWPALANTKFYAYGATVNDASLFSEVRSKDKVMGDLCDQFDRTKGDCVPRYRTVNDFLRDRDVHLIRTIASDDVLARAVINELHLRGVDPGIMERKADGKTKLELGKSSFPGEQHIALISEWDTYYARTFWRLMQDCAVRGYDTPVDEGKPDGHAGAVCQYSGDGKRSWVHVRTYLHGLDGATPQNRKSESNKSDLKASREDGSKDDADVTGGSRKDLEKRQPDLRTSERAFGQGQYDYLRRLARDLKAEDDELQRNDEGSIRAIGVVGGDVFDKLLVLRALKPVFPEAIFFTDDFDALLGLESELRWTRNLLVATSFGPKLADDRQKDLPPFRNYVETSAFLATQLAVAEINRLSAQQKSPPGDQPDPNLMTSAAPSSDPRDGRSVATDFDGAQRKITGWLETPRIFEIEPTGGMLALNEDLPQHDARCRDDPLACKSIQPGDPPLYPAIDRWVGLLLGLVLAVLWIYAVWKMVAYRGALHNKREQSYEDKKGSKFTFEDFTCWILDVLIGVFVLCGLCVVAIFWLWPTSAKFMTSAGDPMSLMQGVSIWPSIFLRAFTLGLAAWFIFDAWRNLDKNLRLVGKKLRLASPEAIIVENHKESDFHLSLWGKARTYLSYQLRDQATVTDEPICKVEALWKRYVVQGRPVARFWRVIGWSILFFLSGVVLATMFGFPAQPGRGLLARRLHIVLAYADFLAMLFLVFFVVDATWLCSNFVKRLANNYTQWPDNTKIWLREKLELKQSCLKEDAHDTLDDWIDVYFIALRTSCITKLIYYPFVIIALIIVCSSSVFGNFYLYVPRVIVTGLSIAIVIGLRCCLTRSPIKRGESPKHICRTG
jgi:hypothetical protein